MAKKNTDMENEETENGEGEVETKLDENQYYLSTKVLIRINKADIQSSNVTRDLMLGVFKNIKLDKKGQVIEGSDPLKSATAIIGLQDTLLSNFVTMERTIEYELENNPNLDKKWFSKLRKSPILLQNMDLDDEADKEFLFLKYVAFADQSDWALLIEKTIGNQNQ